jgi:MarR family 2-MHQ and catechol resistance regulon transcriptional repressor
LLRAEATVRKRVAAELNREGVSPAGFSVLVVLTTAGGSAELKTLRRRLGWSRANATEVTANLQERGLVRRRRDPGDRRLVVVDLTFGGRELVERLFPEHSDRVTRAFGALDETEKRSLAELCRKLAA